MNRLRRPAIFTLAAWGGMLVWSEPTAGVMLLLCALIAGILTEPVV